jgi:proteasome accessory factor C
MSAADRLARLLALVPWLEAHPGLTMRECAEHFGITAAQLEADLYLLVLSGDGVISAADLVDIQFWADDLADEESDARFDATIRVVNPQSFDRPMRLSASEAMSLLVALRMLEQLPGVADHDAISSVVAKLEGATAPSGVDAIVIDVAVEPAVRAVVDEALMTGSELLLRYAAATTGEITERQVAPYQVTAVDGVAYLDAFCRFAGARRTFRLDRVLSAALIAAPAAEAPEGRDETATMPPVPVRASTTAVLELDGSSGWVAEAYDTTVIAQLADGGSRVRLAMHDPQWAVRLVLSLGGAARVVEPASLAEAVADAARSALAAYSGPLR